MSFSTFCSGSFRIIILVSIVISYSWKDDGTVSCMLMLMFNSVIKVGLFRMYIITAVFRPLSGPGKEVAEGEGDHAGTPQTALGTRGGT